MTSDIYGTWRGVLDTGVVNVPLALRLDPAGSGGIACLTTRHQANIALLIVRRGDRLALTTSGFDVALNLSADPAGVALAGEFHHGGCAFPVRFERGGPPSEAHAPRPQTPRGPAPYESRPFAFPAADGARLAGTLTLPPDGAPQAAVILSTWHGRVDRDQTTAGHKPFAIWADQLSRRGLATLRFDKRGAGASEGDFGQVTTADSAADLAQAVALLRRTPGIDPDRIALFGHSEGGHISADLAATDPRIAACVMLTPSGAPEQEIFATDLFRLARAVGGRPLWPEQSLQLAFDLSEAGRTAATGPEAVARTRAILAREAAAGRFPAVQIERRAALAGAPWQRHWWTYDHTASLARLACPTLVMFAGRDLQTPPEHHAPRVRAALAGKPGACVVELSGLNHFLQPAITGAHSEYAAISQTLAPEAIGAVCGWLAAVLDR